MKLPTAPPVALQELQRYLEGRADELGLVLEREFVFHPRRKWRFDFCFPEIMLAVEYDGLMSGDASHASVGGILRDAEKANEAQLLGWMVIRMNAKTIHDRTGAGFLTIERALDRALGRAGLVLDDAGTLSADDWARLLDRATS